MNTKTPKLAGIEALRFFFMLGMCLTHSDFPDVVPHSYIVVEFFFILSGMFIFKSFMKKEKAKGTLQYTWDKFVRFFPPYFLSCFFSLILIFPAWMNARWTVDFFVENSMNFITNILMLCSTGLYRGILNGPLWYLCVLLVGGGLLYGMLKCNKQLSINVLFPLIVILSYTAIFNVNNGRIVSFDVIGGAFCWPLWRGIADMALGVLLCQAFVLKQDFFNGNKRLVDVVSVISLAYLIFMMFSYNNYERYVILFSSLLLLGCFMPNGVLNRLFNNKIWFWLGGISLEMLLVHVPMSAVVRQVLKLIPIPQCLHVVVFLIAVVFAAWLLKLASAYLVNVSAKFGFAAR